MRQQNPVRSSPESRVSPRAYVNSFFERFVLRPRSRFRTFFRYRYQAFFLCSGNSVNRLFLIFIKVLIKLRKASWGQVESIFIHIPKTAGSSIRTQMEKAFGRALVTINSPRSIAKSLRLPCAEVRGIVLEHVNPMLLVSLGLLSEGDVNRSAFSIIRNPQERFHSAWAYGVHRKYFPHGKSPADVLNLVQSVTPGAFTSAEAEGYLFLRPQTDFLVGVDFQSGRLWRMEQLRKSSKLFPRQLGPMELENVGLASQRQEYPSHSLETLILETYWKDTELWENLGNSGHSTV